MNQLRNGLTCEQKEKCNQIFDIIDANKSGIIDKDGKKSKFDNKIYYS